MTEKKRRLRPGSIPSLLAAVLGTAYLVYIISYFFGQNADASGDAAEAIGTGLATLMVMPHIVCVCCAVLMNWLGVMLRKTTGFLLTGGILYVVGGAIFFMYFVFVVVQAILCFVGYARRKKALKRGKEQEAK